MKIAIWVIAYIIVSFCLVTPFKVSSAESRREEREIREGRK